jgi:hypothetical protein
MVPLYKGELTSWADHTVDDCWKIFEAGTDPAQDAFLGTPGNFPQHPQPARQNTFWPNFLTDLGEHVASLGSIPFGRTF